MSRENMLVWRVLSWKYLSGGFNSPGFKRHYLYDDLVVSDRVQGYVDQMELKGIEYMKWEKLGTLKFVMDNNLHPEPRPGAKRLSSEKHNTKLEVYNV